MFKKFSYLIMLLCAMSVLPGCKKTDSEDSETDKGAKAKKEISEAIEATDEYFSEQKDAVMKQAKETYSNLESETRQLIANVKEKGKENAQEISSTLDSKLDSAQQKLEELKKAGKENWGDTEEAFNTAITELKDAYQKAKAKYQDSGNQN